MVDGKTRVGDEVYIHGYIDEIRNDVIIIRNEGGYFGTSDREIFYYEEDERGYGTMNEADRKTEPQYSEDDMYWLSLAEDVANGKMSDAGANQAWLEYINHKTEPTGYNLSPVDKDINVRSNSSEKPNNCETCANGEGDIEACGYCRHGDLYKPKTEPQSGYCNECKWYGDKQVCGRCRSRNLYAPKDEPQTERMTEEEFDTMLAKVLVGQTESTGSPIGDYRDGVGAWQKERSE